MALFSAGLGDESADVEFISGGCLLDDGRYPFVTRYWTRVF